MRTVPGHLQLIIGPMFSGKSTELIRRVRRFAHAKLQCLVIKYKNDTRYSEEKLSTHDKMLFEAKPVTRLSEVRPYLANADVIGIDEGQFFPDCRAQQMRRLTLLPNVLLLMAQLVEFCLEAANAGKVVIVAALDGTFERKPFGSVCELIPAAENVIKLNAVCTICGHDAAFTRRIVADQSVELIGGSDLYEPRCRQCFDVDA